MKTGFHKRKNSFPLMKIIFLFFLVSCGTENRTSCISQESKILQCRAERSAENFYNTLEMLEFQREQCERDFPLNKCY